MRTRTNDWLVLVLVAIGIAMRLIPHPANVAPIAALALFSGATLAKKYAFAVPLAAMIISDVFLGFHATIPYTWGSFALIGVLGWQLQRRRTIARVGGMALAGSVLFYVATNFGVWASTSLYPKTAEGLVACFIAALPFFRNTIAGDLFYTAVFFGLYELAAYAVRKRATHPFTTPS